MPLYEYECPACGAKIEVLQKLGEDGTALKCPGCAVTGLRKVISGCAVQSVGAGKFSSTSGCTLGSAPRSSGFT